MIAEEHASARCASGSTPLLAASTGLPATQRRFGPAAGAKCGRWIPVLGLVLAGCAQLPDVRTQLCTSRPDPHNAAWQLKARDVSQAMAIIHRDYVETIDEEVLAEACLSAIPTSPAQRSVPSGSARTRVTDALNSVQASGGNVSASVAAFSCMDAMLAVLDGRSKLLRDAEYQGQVCQFAGIGVEFAGADKGVRLVTVFGGGPGEAGGLRAGDVITAIDGEPLSGLALADVLARLHGPKDSHVTLTVAPSGDPMQERTLTLTRAPIDLRDRELWARWMAPGLAYVKIHRLTEWSTRDLSHALMLLQEQEHQQPSGIILDLRGNPGGLLNTVVGMAAAFLPADTLVLESRGRSASTTLRLTAAPGNYRRYGTYDPLWNLPDYAHSAPLIVLVDVVTSEGAAAVAAAIQDNHRGRVVGTTTDRHGDTQTLYPVGNVLLKLTTGRIYRADGRALDGAGVTPDRIAGEPGPDGLPPMPTQLGSDPVEPDVAQDPMLAVAVQLLNEQGTETTSARPEDSPPRP